MKTFYLSAIFICIFLVVGYAQQKTDVEFGMQAGYSRSGVDLGAGATGDATIGGFNAGIYADMYWNDRWSMKVKVLYDQKGFSQRGYISNLLIGDYQPSTPAPTVVYNNIHLNYITVPLMVNWHFGQTRRWYLDFGPYAAFLLTKKDPQAPPGSQYISTQYYATGYNSIILGLALGIGYKYPVSKHLKLFMEFETQNDLANTLDGPVNSDSSYQNVRGSFNIGVNF